MTATTGYPTGSESSARLRVHILHPPPDDAISLLMDLLDSSIDVTMGPKTVESCTEILVAGRPSHEHLHVCTSLKALIIPYAGVPAETRELLLESYPKLPVYNLHHNAVAASELAFALFLAAAKTLIPVDRKFRAHDWRSRYDGAPTMLLDGKMAVIIGFGAIGARLATMCLALGMKVHGVRRHSERPPAFQKRRHCRHNRKPRNQGGGAENNNIPGGFAYNAGLSTHGCAGSQENKRQGIKRTHKAGKKRAF